MIYEVRTYDLKPHSVPEVEKRFGEAYEFRKTLSPLAAFWHIRNLSDTSTLISPGRFSHIFKYLM